MKNRGIVLFIGILLLCAGGIGAQVDYDALSAQENFREGIVRFHRGSYNEAILSFQRSLSFKDDDPLVREWLGRAYYFSGFVEAALNEWEGLEDEGLASVSLQAFADGVRARSSLAAELLEDRDYLIVEQFEAREYPGGLRNPAGLVSDGQGRLIVSSFGSNSLQMLDQSGRQILNLNGGFRALSGPFDIELYGESIFVSNFLSDSISVLDLEGNTRLVFGSPGIGAGNLLGPQYLALSEEPALYVADFGNQRIVKFTPEGEYLFHFGEPAAFRDRVAEFPGFTRLGGLAVLGDRIFAADNGQTQTRLQVFDFSGNQLESLPLPGVRDVEDVSATDEGRLLITSRSAVYLFDPVSLGLTLLHEGTPGDNPQFVASLIDDNRNLIISDFRNSRALYLSRLSGIYSGYQVEITRVDASGFPRVLVELSVRDVLGQEILGLGEQNFIMTEEGQSLENWELEYSGSFDQFSSTAFVLEASNRRNEPDFVTAQNGALVDALDSLPEGTRVRLFSAGISPVLEFDSDSDPDDLPAILTSLTGDSQWRLDQAIRLAGDRLILDQNKRELVFVGSGNLPDWAFESIGLAQTLAYLRNNHIRFSVVLLSPVQVPDDALEFLVEGSGGDFYYPDQPRGLASLGEDMSLRRTGIYMLSTQSLFDADFGRKYLPIEVEVSHFTKSGRDESGYFGPLEF